MKNNAAHMSYVGKEISPEQFVAEHTLAYVLEGVMHVYDGNKQVSLHAGDCYVARKNRLARYNKEKVNDRLEKVFVFFDAPFLKAFQERHQPEVVPFPSTESLIEIDRNELLVKFIQSLLPYYDHGKITAAFSDVKREELLILLLQQQPELSGLLFDFGIPEKIDIEAFMNRNFRFNVSIPRFAYLTGRSLSAFKRDFRQVFDDTPNHWLLRKRLQEAHFMIEKEHKKPSEIYLELGFEDLSHFSFAFKKQFGIAPTELMKQGRNVIE